MSKMSDFEFTAQSWSDRWNLHYVGSDKQLVIPAELITKAGKPVGIRLFADNANEIISIAFPNNVTDVWFGTFYEKELRAIHVASDNPFLKKIDGVLFSKDGKKLIKAPCKMQGEYIVPRGVETLFKFCFRKSELERVTLPNSVTEISDFAFEQCDNLIAVNLPDSITTIGDNAFKWCKKLDNISIPANVCKMNFNAFAGSDGLCSFEFKGKTEIEFSYSSEKDISKFIEKQLSGEGFWYNSEAYLLACLKQFPKLDKNLQRFIAATVRGNRKAILEFLNSLKSTKLIDKGAFRVKVLSDTEVEIEKYIGEEETIEIPSVIDGKKVVTVGVNAFKGNDYICRVIIPDGVIKICPRAFANCISLEEVKLPESCQKIEFSVFSGCKSLKRINLPNGLSVLSENVFFDCASLETLELPDGLLSLGKESFYACLFDHGPKLETTWGYTLAEFAIPASVTKIDAGGLFARYPVAEDQFGVFEYKVKLRVAKGSDAHKFAVKNRIKFALVTE